MKLSTENVTIEAAGSLTLAAAATLDAKLASAGFYPPQLATNKLPAAAGVKGMLVYNTTTNKLNISNGTAWEAVTSAA